MPRSRLRFAVSALLLSAIATGCSSSAEVQRSEGLTRSPQGLEVVSPSDSPFPRGYVVVPRSSEEPVAPVSGYDILHTQLRLSFDLAGRAISGSARHHLVIRNASRDYLVFHGAGLDIQKLHVERQGQVVPAVHSARNDEIRVDLRATVHPRDTLDVEFAYIARPTSVSERRGLWFVDPDGSDPSRPTSIWTLGQPEDNRLWFPTWDYPNDRMSFEIVLTVPDSLQTFANGVLIDQIANAEGGRTDRWLMESPQPAYLAAFVVGNYAVAEDLYVSPVGHQVPLIYAVSPEYGPRARAIFGETAEMLEAMESRTAVPFPFPNYKQVVVPDYTAGGMENATVAMFDDRILHDERAHLDYSGRDLIAHELAHQWFGNLVTCADWSNLPLNEGFASFFEQIYLEDRYGRDAGQAHALADRHEYLREAESIRRPIIWTDYEDPNVLFDAHSYEKTEGVLALLRFELGEGVWWNGVRHYLNSYANQAVTIDDLRASMEFAARKPLDVFFHQWFMEPGHPELLVEHEYDDDLGLYQLRVRQVQDSAAFPLYKLDLSVEFNYDSRTAYRERVRIGSRDTTLRFGVSSAPLFVRFDEGDNLPGEIIERKPLMQWINQALADDEMAGRYDAVVILGSRQASRQIRDVLLEIAASDPHHFVRQTALQQLDRYAADPLVIRQARIQATSDPSSDCRRAAIRLLAASADPSGLVSIRAGLRDSSYFVVAAAVRAYAILDPDGAFAAFSPILGLRSWENTVELAVTDVLVHHPVAESAPYLEGLLELHNSERVRAAALTSYAELASLGKEWKSHVKRFVRRYTRDVHASVRAAAVSIDKQL